LIAVCAYFVNQHPEKLADLLGVTKWTSPAPAEVSRAAPPVLVAPGTSGVPTPSETSNTIRKPVVATIPLSVPASQVGPAIDTPAAPPTTDGKDVTAVPVVAKHQTPSSAAIDTVMPASSSASPPSPPAASMAGPPIQSRANAASSPQAGICSDALAAAGLCRDSATDSQAQAPIQSSRAAAISQPGVSAIDPRVRTPPSATEAKVAVEAQQAPSGVTAKSRNETERPDTNRVVRVDSASRSAATSRTPAKSQADRGGANASPAVPGVSVCTEALAAAGLCIPISAKGSK
jgi:hypothetical protein